ncbi:peptide deformylase 2 [Virgisporangium aliadipatigenens]|uniref:Peptide deformylase n=1 Tax=Virgisporangium aliadipatigenens TaxID=741659 RepID=A0A8J3YRT1_9ACTN|nr:peptide deformylase [Virgisporangium aliadipatigenens]GIJ49312.1 peptide deformylase 2 [Virgisporangium aliadipatigenens]
MSSQEGRVHPISYYGDPVLHRRCAEVLVFGRGLGTLVEDMFASMYAADGVGLAANQIGVDLRVFVYDCTDAGNVRRIGHVVNPVLEATAGASSDEEGCLSVPGPRAALTRPASATVSGFDRTGRPITVTGTGTLARCLQHETDHLDGTLYVDHLTPRRRADVLREAGFAA